MGTVPARRSLHTGFRFNEASCYMIMGGEVKIRFYGMLRDYAGVSELSLRFNREISGNELLRMLAERLPGLREVLDPAGRERLAIVILVDNKPYDNRRLIGDEAVVDILPPASGG